jgi:pyrroline-5-carboxylate reductase
MTAKLERPLLLVGCGKMGSAMLSGWQSGGMAAAGVYVVEPYGLPDTIDPVGAQVVPSDEALPDDLDPEVVVFAVKPQQMDEVAPRYKRFVAPGTLFVSIAAGTTIGVFEKHLGETAAIVRAMPNTPAAIGQGITVACPNARATKDQVALAEALLSAIGECLSVKDEALMDPVTALSGSGPAYVFLMIEAMAAAGAAAGLPQDMAERLALVTVAGAGQLALQGPEMPSTLRENVTSPGGTTFAALQVLMADPGLKALMAKAIDAATERSRELAS